MLSTVRRYVRTKDSNDIELSLIKKIYIAQNVTSTSHPFDE